jgi:hypothetical protein
VANNIASSTHHGYHHALVETLREMHYLGIMTMIHTHEDHIVGLVEKKAEQLRNQAL